MNDIHDFKKKAFDSQLGSQAQVSRSTETSERSTIANAMLREIGRNINQLETSEYVGSCAVHVYRPKGHVQYLHFQCQVAPMQDVPEHIASKALDDLRGTLQESYGQKRQTKRSGF